MAKLYITNTTIDPTEVTRVLDKGMKLMADLAVESAYTEMYSLNDDTQCVRRLLYIYLFSIESWINCEGAVNYLTEQQLMNLLADVENLFRVCKPKIIT